MNTRQELEERLESILNEISSEIEFCRGKTFDGQLEDAIFLTKELKSILKKLNEDNYVDEESEEENEDAVKKNSSDFDNDDFFWNDDYDDGY